MKTLRAYLPESFIVELAPAPTDTQSPIGGQNDRPVVPEAIGLELGDTVTIKGQSEYAGKKGKVVDFGEGHVFTTVNVDGKDRSFHTSDIKKVEVEKDDSDEEFKHAMRNIQQLRGL